MEKQVNISSKSCIDKISEGSYVVFKSGASHINDDKRLETRFLVVMANDSHVAIKFQDIGLVAIEKGRLELAPNQEKE